MKKATKNSIASHLATAIGLILVIATPALACEKPKPGKYWLGWGTARLMVPQSGRPYQYFRGTRYDLPGKYCLSGDNIGVTRMESNGTVWAYTTSPD